MENIQKWFMVAATWVIAIGLLLNALNGRYKFAKLYEPYQNVHNYSRFDTWTGEIEVKHLTEKGWIWERGSALWVQKVE